MLMNLWTAILIGMMIPAAHADFDGTKGSISVRTEAFLSPDYQATTKRQYNFIGAGMKTPGLGPNNRFEDLESGMQMDLEGQFAPEAPALSYMNVRQTYYKESIFSIGRKLENWSDLDERWHLGIYQPQFRWNPMLPESQGLSGLFLNLNGQVSEIPWGVLVFGSVLYLPDQGPGYNLKNGRFESVNPWFPQLPHKAEINGTGVQDDLRYDLQQPDSNRILFNSSYVAQAHIGDLYKGLSFRAAYAYKPSNQLAMGVDGESTNQEAIDIRILPQIFYHTVVSADLVYQATAWETGVGALHERSESPQFDSQWSYNSFGESNMISPFFGLKMNDWRVRAMTLHMNEPEVNAQGPKASLFQNVLPAHVAFRDAYAVEASTRHYWRKHEGLKGSARYTEGSRGEFSLVTAELQYQIDSRWSVSGQTLFVRSNAPTGKDKVLYSDFEDNDSLRMGALYVF